MYEEGDKSVNKIFAEALIQIIDNQMALKKHLGVVHNTQRYGDCYDDNEVIDVMKCVE